MSPLLTISSNWHVLDPGAAHISSTKSVGYGSKSNGGNIETNSYLVNNPVELHFYIN